MGGDPGVATGDTRREFDQIVARLTADDPSLATPRRHLPTRVTLTILAVVGALVWAGLCVLMVVWGAAGVALTCLAVVAAAATAAHLTRHR